jgi:hypothetical protein
MQFLGLLAAVAAFSASGLVVFAFVSERLEGRATAVRISAAVCALLWLAFLTFQILGLLGLFRLPVVLLVCLVLPLLVLMRNRSRIRAILQDAVEQMKDELGELGAALKAEPWVAAGVGVVALHLTLRLARILATPTFGWDDFTYHLFRAGRWVQTGSLGLEPAPDAWTYYEFFPWAGDALWAWALIWQAGDVLVPVMAIGIWLSILVATFALTRALGQGPVTGLLITLAVGTLPSQLTQLNTAYVDNGVLLMAVIAALCVVEMERGGRSAGSLLLFGASCGLGVAIKLTFLPVAAAGALASAVWAWQRRRPSFIWAFCAGSAIVLPNWIFNLVHRGSPFYPFRVVEALPYNQALENLLSSAPSKDFSTALSDALKALLINVRDVDPFLNVGWLGLCLLLLGLVGGVRRSKTVGSPLFLVWAVITAVSVAAPALVGKGVLLLAQWLNVLGRFWVPGFVALFTLTGNAGKRLVRWFVLPLLLLELFAYAPRKWPAPIPSSTLQVWWIGVVLLAGLWWVARRPGAGWKKRTVAWVAMSAALALATVPREAIRYDCYRLFANWELDDFHHNNYIRGWPLWKELDGKEARTLAATAGFGGGIGHNWFRSPLLGSRLQREVLYVPITTDGELVSYEDAGVVAAKADRRAWLGRLLDREIDYVAALGPRSIEHAWVEELPEVFTIELASQGGSWILARVDRGRLEARLSATQ